MCECDYHCVSHTTEHRRSPERQNTPGFPLLTSCLTPFFINRVLTEAGHMMHQKVNSNPSRLPWPWIHRHEYRLFFFLPTASPLTLIHWKRWQHLNHWKLGINFSLLFLYTWKNGLFFLLCVLTCLAIHPAPSCFFFPSLPVPRERKKKHSGIFILIS